MQFCIDYAMEFNHYLHYKYYTQHCNSFSNRSTMETFFLVNELDSAISSTTFESQIKEEKPVLKITEYLLLCHKRKTFKISTIRTMVNFMKDNISIKIKPKFL